MARKSQNGSDIKVVLEFRDKLDVSVDDRIWQRLAELLAKDGD